MVKVRRRIVQLKLKVINKLSNLLNNNKNIMKNQMKSDNICEGKVKLFYLLFSVF